MKGKKAQAGIGENIGNILQTMPTPIKLGLFLLFLLLFVAVFSFLLNIVGVHCSSSDQVYTLPMYDVYKNLKLIFSRPSYDEIASQVLPTPNIFILNQCIHRSTNGTCYYDGGYCTDCQETTIPDIGGYKTEVYCESDVYRVADKTWFKKWTCETANIGCEPPTGFYFNQTLCGYICVGDNQTCSGLTAGKIWDRKLEDLGGRLLYSQGETQGRAYDDVFRISCISFKPTLKFFGIPVFDFKIWLFLIVITAFGTALIKIHNMD